MRFLRKNTAVIVTVGPFYDKTDGVTIETALTITNERITLTADTDDGAAPTNILDNIAGATAATANDLNYITGNDAGMMQLELAAADTNRLGRMFLSITDAANHVPVFHEFMVVNAVLYDSFFSTTAGAIPLAVAGATGGNFIAGTNAATTVTTGLTATFTGNLTGSVGSVTGAVGSVTAGVAIADATSDAVIADAVWNAATASYGTAGTYGLLVETDLDAAVSSRMATYTQPTGFLAATFPATVASTTNITAGTITTTTNLTNAPTAGDLTATMKTSVNAEVVDALNVDTYTEPVQGAPGVNISLAAKIGHLYKAWRNKKTQTATEFKLFADDATTVDSKATVSDDGTTATIGEIATGP